MCGDVSMGTDLKLHAVTLIRVCACGSTHRVAAAEEENLERPLQILLQLGLGDALKHKPGSHSCSKQPGGMKHTHELHVRGDLPVFGSRSGSRISEAPSVPLQEEPKDWP